MSGLGFNITANDRQFLDAMRRAGYSLNNFSNQAVSEGQKIEDVFHKIAAAAGITFSAVQLKSFVQSVIQVRGEFQQLGIAFETMLGSKAKADSLMAQMIDTAAKTPFDLAGVANGAKQLLAYGTAAEEVNSTLVRLGNIASGLSIPLNDIVYLYGTTQVQGRLFTMDVRQFMGRGIPLVKELAKELGKTEEQINSMVTAGQIGFDKVKKVLENMTNEGGMFYKLMEKQSASWTGQIANLQDAWDVMLNDMGSKSDTVFNSAIDLATTLVENYEKVGKVLIGMIATYGAYKTACAAAIVVTKGWTIAQMAQYNVLLFLEKAQRLLNATMLSNPYVLATVAVVGLVAAVWALHDSTTAQERAQEQLNRVMDEARQKKEDLEGKTNRLIGIINSETKTIYEQISAYRELQGLYPKVLANMERTAFQTMSATEQQKLLNAAISEFDDANKNAVLNNYKKLQADLKAAGNNGYKQDDVYADITKAFDIGFVKRLGMNGDDLNKMLNETVKLLEKEKKQREENRKEAEFLALPEEEQKKRLQAQLEELKKQETAIDDKIKATGLFNDELNKGDKTLKTWFNNEGKLKNMFAMANPVLQSWISSLNTVRSQINDIENKINPKQDIVPQNKAYWEKIKKDAEAALVDMTPSQVKSKTGQDQVKLLRNAEKQLKNWDFSEKAGKAIENIAEKRLEAQKAIIEKQQDMDNEQINNALDLEQRLIDIKEDSFQKEIELANIEYKKQIQALNEHTQKLIKEQQELEKQQYIAKHGSDKGFKPTTNTYNDLPEQLKSQLIALDVVAGKELEAKILQINKSIASAIKEQDATFASIYEQEVANINIHYLQLLKEAEGQEELINKIISNWNKAIAIAKNNKSIREVDFAEELALQSNQNMESLGMSELVEQKRLDIIKKYGEQRLAILKQLGEQGDEQAAQEAKVLEKKLSGMKSVPKGLKGLADKALFDGIKKGYEDIIKASGKYTEAEIEAGKAAEEAEKKTAKLLDGIAGGAGKVVAIIDDLKGMFGGLSEDLDLALDSIGNIAQGFATGGIVGGAMAVIGEGMKMFAQSAKVNKEHQEALRQLLLARIELQRQYNKLLLEEQLLFKKGTTIFGTDQIGRAINAIDVYRKSIAAYKKEAQGDFTPNDNYQKELENKVAKGGLMGFMYKQKLDEYKKQVSAYNKGVASLASVDIVTGSRKSGWGFWKKRKDVYSDILDVYPKLVDGEGKIDTALAKTIINTHKMSDENKALIQSLIDLQEQAEAAEEELKNYLSETFGSLGDALSDSIVDAFANGEDAALKFQDNVTDVLNNLAKQMVYSLFLSEMFADLQDKIEGVYKKMADGTIDEKQLSKEVTDLLGGFFNGLEGSIGDANKFLESFWQNAEANGFQRPKSEQSSQSSSKGGYETMSQDQAGEMNGRLTGMQMSLVSIDGSVKESLSIQIANTKSIAEQSNYLQQLSSVQLQSMYYLEDIAKCSKVLPEMADNIKGIKKNTDKL
jgi:tape measure domain-containing protein